MVQVVQAVFAPRVVGFTYAEQIVPVKVVPAVQVAQVVATELIVPAELPEQTVEMYEVPVVAVAHAVHVDPVPPQYWVVVQPVQGSIRAPL